MDMPEYLPGLRKIEMEIADLFDSICKKHNLRYSIAYGTLLGAVRHGGFIPWDDDVDIMMPREDYDRFIRLWETEAHQGYILMNKHTNYDFTQTFTKIRKDHTTFLQGKSEQGVSYHTGVFIDIMPADRVAPHKLARKWQIFLSALNLLYARGYPSDSTGLRKMAERFLLSFPASFRKWAYFKSETAKGKWNGNQNADWFVSIIIDGVNKVFDSQLFDKLTTISFEDREYSCFFDKDKYLRVQYGDQYMQLPPEEKRVFRHVHTIVSLDKNFSELQEENRG